MNIGFDGKRALHNNRGLGNFSRTLLEGLRNYTQSNNFHIFSPEIKKKEFLEWKEKNDFFEYHFPEKFIDKKVPSLWRSVFLGADINKNKIDLFHGLSHELPMNIKQCSVKTIVTIHDLIYLRYPHFFPYIDRKVYDFKFKRACRDADKILAICHQTKNDLINFFNISEEKIEVHYQACNPQFYNTVSTEDKEILLKKYNLEKSFILFIGAFEERKNAMGLLKAFHKIYDKTDCDLVLIGRGKKYKQDLINYINENKLINRVKVLDNVPYQENPGLCQMADIIVYPSFFEGFGLPIVEGMFSKTPVITSKGGVFPEAGGEAAYYIDPYDINSIAEGILKVSSSNDLKSEMIEKGIKQSNQFHIVNTSKKLMDTYQGMFNA